MMKGNGAVLDRHYEAIKNHVKEDQSTRRMKLPFGMYSANADAAVGSWVLLAVDTAEEQDANIGAVPTYVIDQVLRATTDNVTLGLALFCQRQGGGCVSSKESCR